MQTCVRCYGAVRIVASVEDPTAIRAILGDFEKPVRWSRRTTAPHRANYRRPRDEVLATEPITE